MNHRLVGPRHRGDGAVEGNPSIQGTYVSSMRRRCRVVHGVAHAHSTDDRYLFVRRPGPARNLVAKAFLVRPHSRFTEMPSLVKSRDAGPLSFCPSGPNHDIEVLSQADLSNCGSSIITVFLAAQQDWVSFQFTMRSESRGRKHEVMNEIMKGVPFANG